MLVGEAPGRWEHATGRPFVGPSGQKLEDWWRRVGLQRGEFWIDNVYPYWPRQGIDAVPQDEIEYWIGELHARLADLTDPWLIVPTGNKALYALTGQGKMRQGEKKPGITSHRGSIYSYTDRRGREIKVIPTIHPAHTLWRASRKRDEGVVEQRNWERACILDWTRIAEDATFRELRLPQREHFIRPTLDDVYDYLYGAIDSGDPIAVDIENLPDYILCVGFSNDPSFSMTVPTTPSYWKDASVLREVWNMIRAVVGSRLEKIGQNWLYDAWHLSRNGCEIVNFAWDCLAQHHCLDPVDNHDLAYMASIFTRQPYWKDETKDPEEVMKYASDEEALWTYCGIDAAVERELSDTLHMRLAAAGRMGFYNRYYRQLFAPILRIMLHGVGLDDYQRRHKLAALQARIIDNQDRLTEIAGEPLYGKTDLSTKKLKQFLYNTLRLSPILNRKTGRATTNEVAVRRLLLRYPNKPVLAEAGGLILDHRRTATVARFLKEERLDPDGRWRFTMGPYAETCRMRASKNPAKRGASPHNFDRELRDIVKPDLGCVFLGVDLCVDGNTQVLMADLTWKYARDVTEGDIVVGFDESFKSPLGISGTGSKFRSAIVTNNEPMMRDCVEVATDKASVICSREHLWPARRKKSNNRRWYKAESLVPGDRIPFTSQPWEVERTYDAGWLAGFIDGEGWMSTASRSTSIAFGQNPNEVLGRAIRLIEERGFEYVHRLQSGRVTNFGKRSRVIAVRILGGWKNSTRFIGQIRPSKVMKRATGLWEGRRTWGHRSEPATVASVKSVGKRMVYPISTTTHTFIADGLLSHNSQAEDRVVKMLTRSKRLIKLARLHPDEWDAHKHSAHIAFGTAIDEVTYDERYLGKRAKHAVNYDMRGRRLSDELLKEGYVVPPEESQRIIDKLHADSPEIKEVYHKETRAEVMRNRCLSNIWGAIIDFEYERLDDDLYRRAYAWRPQSDIAILMNLWGFIPADEYLLKPCCRRHSHAGIKPAINLHMQDGLWISTPPEHAWDIAVFLQSSLEQPVYYYGEPITIWCEFSLGSTWKAEHEWKRLPNRKEFTDVAHSLLGEFGSVPS